MKLITAIVSKEDAHDVNHALVHAGFRLTRLSTSGGFLLATNVTFLIGAEDDQVDTCIKLLAQHSRRREELIPAGSGYAGMFDSSLAPLTVNMGGATVFVTPVERFEQL